MNSFMAAIIEFTFLQNAIAASLLASVACGITAVFVVIKRITFISGGIAHAVLGGIGIAYYLGYPPIMGAFVFAILAAILLGLVKLKAGQYEDTVIGALWAVGMATGVIFIYLSPGYNVDLLSFLFGNILMVTQKSLWFLVYLDFFIIVVVSLFYKQFLAISFDQEFALIRGINTSFFYILLLLLIALTVVILIQIVGLILVISLLTLPAAIAKLFLKTPGKMIFVASVLGLFFSLAGIYLSFIRNLPSGATIVLFSGIAYLTALVFKQLFRHRYNAMTLRSTEKNRNLLKG